MTIKIRPCVCVKGDLQFYANGQCIACKGTQVQDTYRAGVLKNNLNVKCPSIEEYLAFDGAHCHRIYNRLSEDWRCPGCWRTKFEILRWTILYPHKPESRRPGWAGGYHEHHDHAGDKYLRTGQPLLFHSRFTPIVVCEQCNSADSAAKRKLNLPADFSYSPWEIRQFVTSYAHGKHLVDYQIAHGIYLALQP
jgi:hypothetical protein